MGGFPASEAADKFCAELGEKVEHHILSTGNFAVFPGDSSSVRELTRFDYYSNGIRLALVGLSSVPYLYHLFCAQISCAWHDFNDMDFGTFYSPGESRCVGFEYGEYETLVGKIWIHRTNFDRLTVYFPFEN